MWERYMLKLPTKCPKIIYARLLKIADEIKKRNASYELNKKCQQSHPVKNRRAVNQIELLQD